MRRIIAGINLFLFAIMAMAAAARAQSTVETEYTTSSFVIEDWGVEPGGTVWLAFRQDVSDNWHVFWKNPGDAGLPLSLDWEMPPGYAAGEILFPAPQYIPVGPLASYAHEGEPAFLVPITAPSDAVTGGEVQIKVTALWQACEEICVPEEAKFEFSLPVVEVSARRRSFASVFTRARAAMPVRIENAAHIASSDANYVLDVEDWPYGVGEDIFYFPAIEGVTAPAAPQNAVIENGVLKIFMKPGWLDGLDTDELDGVISFGAAGDKTNISVNARLDAPLVRPKQASGGKNSPIQAANQGIVSLLAFAFFGGLILNAMPCVFPILFVKAASLAHYAADKKAAQKFGFTYAAGVLVTFLAIAGLLLALRAGGEQLGWGFHLQSPPVVALSAYVLFLVGLNLSGVFSVGESLAGAGDGWTRKAGHAGAFFTGALAVVVAAPCIGPLLTAPMGAALARPPLVGLAIFTSLALGFAAPFVAISFVPGLAEKLPRPGPWMARFKQALAFPVYGAAAYFLWVFARQVGDNALAAVLAGTIFLAAGAWLFEISKAEGRLALVARGMAALLVVAAAAPLFRVEPASASIINADENIPYGSLTAEPYEAAALDQYIASGTPVFIDFTAAWCVTCQFNKMTVLKTSVVADAFRNTNTVLMVADWTVRDPEITAALGSFGASGVPLYVHYDSAGAASILPPAISKKIVINALTGAADG